MRRLLVVIAGAGFVLLPLAALAQAPAEPPVSAKFDAAFAPAEPAPSQGFGTAAGEDRWSDDRMRTAAPVSRPDVGSEPGKLTPSK